MLNLSFLIQQMGLGVFIEWFWELNVTVHVNFSVKSIGIVDGNDAKELLLCGSKDYLQKLTRDDESLGDL